MTPQTEPVAIDVGALAALNDQLWRRLGITQTFDRLLVEAVAREPGPADAVRKNAGRTLTAGAAKFYDLSFPQLLKDLCRRNVLADTGGQVRLDASFADKLRRLIGDQSAGQSRVEPTPGVTLEDVLQAAELRAQRDKLVKDQAKKRAPKVAKEKKAAAEGKAGTSPKRRDKSDASSEPAPRAQKAQVDSAPTRTPAASLFTSIRLNKLIEVLDTGALNKEQLAGRVGLASADLDRFLQVCEANGLVRTTGASFELHWQGRELARTASADRRMAVMDAVKTLREKAAELDA